MQRRDDPSGRLSRGQGPGGRAAPRRPPRGGGGARGAAAQPPPPGVSVVGGTSGPGGSGMVGGKMEPENKYLPELMAEKDSLDPSFTHAMQLLTAEFCCSSGGFRSSFYAGNNSWELLLSLCANNPLQHHPPASGAK
uniref:KH domain-containing, RNA-binding, signal transduction-associated protein 1-like n=1 Tax=Lonchura striata TaxID=40157 RepID=UPI000B4C75DB|nr:KH domain-containing, RNA-binding, signal transduction-associated protein 1-like [Lonchura striata domestica]